MNEQPSVEESMQALGAVDRSRRAVVEQFGLPSWYWLALAAGWIGLAVLTDLQHPWLTTSATLAFGAIHSSAYSHLAAGRRAGERIQIAEVTVGRSSWIAVVVFLLGLAAVTAIGAVLLRNDGAGHPVTLASVPVAIAIVLGGPQLVGLLRQRALRRVSS